MKTSDEFLKALNEAQYKDVLKIIKEMQGDMPPVVNEDRRLYWEGFNNALVFLKRRLVNGR